MLLRRLRRRRPARQAAHPQPLHTAGIGVEHLELDAGRVLDDLAAARYPPGEGEDEAAQRIDLLLGPGHHELDSVALLELLDRRASIGDHGTVRSFLELRPGRVA